MCKSFIANLQSMQFFYFSNLILISLLLHLNHPRAAYSPSAPVQLSPLARYGRALFQREDCGNCHRTDTKLRLAQHIGLAGMAGRYTDLWLYRYFQDPEVLIFHTKKQAYPHLYEQELEESFWNNIPLAQRAEATWRAVQQEAALQQAQIEAEGQQVPQVEALALVAYLQQLYPENSPAEASSISALQKQLRAVMDADYLDLDSSSIIMQSRAATGSVKKGAALFARNCAPCHGEQGQGLIGPNLTDAYWLHGGRTEDIARTLVHGVPKKGMLAWKNILEPEEIGALVAFIQSIQGSDVQQPKAPQGKKE